MASNIIYCFPTLFVLIFWISIYMYTKIPFRYNSILSDSAKVIVASWQRDDNVVFSLLSSGSYKICSRLPDLIETAENLWEVTTLSVLQATCVLWHPYEGFHRKEMDIAVLPFWLFSVRVIYAITWGLFVILAMPCCCLSFYVRCWADGTCTPPLVTTTTRH